MDGNLELTWLQDEDLDLSFLQYIREVGLYIHDIFGTVGGSCELLMSHPNMYRTSITNAFFSQFSFYFILIRYVKCSSRG